MNETPQNPSVSAASEPPRQRVRVPMSLPTQRFQVPEIPGKHLHWFLEERVPRALEGGYEFVHTQDLPVNQRNVATSTEISGSQDLGDRIRVSANDSSTGQYHVLMMIKLEWWNEDQAALAERNAGVLGAIFRNEPISAPMPDGADPSQTYSKTHLIQKPLFQRGTRKVR